MRFGVLYLSLLPSAALAFQQVANNNIVTPLYRRATTTALHIVPKRFERAQHCATHYGSCDVEEMEELANELEHFQDHLGGADGMPSVFRDNGSKVWSSAPMTERTPDDFKDTKIISELLRKQSDLMQSVDDYVKDHNQPNTFDMSDV